MADFNNFNMTPEPHALIKVIGVRRRRLERGRSHGRRMACRASSSSP